MKTDKEVFVFEVTVLAEYFDKPTLKDRKYAIKKAKENILSPSILGSISVKQTKVKLLKVKK